MRFPVLALTALLLPFAAFAQPEVTQIAAIVASPAAKSGAVYFTLTNPGPEADRLVAVQTDAAMRAELHSSNMDQAGVMSMAPLDGIDLAPGAQHALERGGDHLMLMGLTRSFAPGDKITLVLEFKKAGPVTVEAEVSR